MCKSASPLHAFLKAIPKCEHHVHLEGCLSPALVFELAAKNNVKLPADDPAYASPDALRERYARFTSLDDFLHYYYCALAVVVTAHDYELLAYEYFSKAHADGVRHAEVFFDPQSHTARGVAFATVVDGFNAGRARAQTELGMTTQLIMCFLRHLPVPEADETMRQAIDGHYFSTDRPEESAIVGIGLDSSEVGFPPELFRAQYAQAETLGIRRTAHGGEEGGPAYIRGALDALHVERIDHGIRLAEDPALLARVAAQGVLLTLCPLSNVCLKAVAQVGDLPVREFLAAGVSFSVNCDDPAYFGGYALANYCALQDAFGLSLQQWRQIAQNSIDCSWTSSRRKAELRAMLEEAVQRHGDLQ